MKKFFPTLFLTLLIGLGYSQSICDSIKLKKDIAYGFAPNELSDSLKNLKSQELDNFWNFAKKNKEESALCIKKLIENEKNDSYFCFDASSLLLSLDTSKLYHSTIISALNKTNLEDIQLSSFLKISYYLAYKGQNINELTTKLISIPNARIYLSDHFITLNAIDAGIFLLNIMGEKNAEETLILAIKNGNPVAKHNAAVLLNVLSTNNGDSLIREKISSGSLPDSTINRLNKDNESLTIKKKGTIKRNRVLEAMKDVPYNFEKEFFGFSGNEDLINSACKVLTKDDLKIVRDARTRSITGLSDEALHEYFTLTAIIFTIKAK